MLFLWTPTMLALFAVATCALGSSFALTRMHTTLVRALYFTIIITTAGALMALGMRVQHVVLWCHSTWQTQAALKHATIERIDYNPRSGITAFYLAPLAGETRQAEDEFLSIYPYRALSLAKSLDHAAVGAGLCLALLISQSVFRSRRGHAQSLKST